ncbi:uncharacterized protein LOC128243391 [Mya arenaria]|uniref:uncharacterized protein LOC128243391 n=1 Tax=Mya arenaria TaxID=6604 RepID=UPI0022E11A5F|nr:uncharacterized protein LOC128243391 [Mya arenaria]XP_052817107.1 uncharacterized protein LOC128243391 [Mya arenaria]XP_052817108.1 uncharacterized protein LOC128243391 [Mya arenaria]
MASILTALVGAAILVSTMTSLHAVPAGIEVLFTQEVLQTCTQLDLYHFIKSMKKVHIPDMVNSSGSFNWQVTGVRVEDVGHVSSSIQLGDGVLHFNANVTKLVISASWAFHSKDQAGVTFQGKGKLNVTSAKTSFNIIAKLSVTEAGGIGTDIIDCGADITQLKIKFYDSDLISFMEMIANSIVADLKKEIKKSFCKAVAKFQTKVEQEINKLQEKTSNITFYNQTFAIDSSVVAVNVTTKAIYVYLKAGFTMNGRKFPINDQHFPTATTASGFEISFAKAVFGNVVQAANDSGLLHYKLGFKEIMANQKFSLNLSCSGIFCAGNVFYKAAERWPGRVIGIRVSATNLALSVGDNFMYLYVDGRVYFTAESADKSDPWFSAAVNIVIPLQLRLENEQMHGKVSAVGGNVTVDQSDYWETLSETLPNILKYYGPLMQEKLQDKLNEHELSFRLPLSKHARIKASKISISSMGVSVSADICATAEKGCNASADTGYVGNATVGLLNFMDTLPVPTTTAPTTKSVNVGVQSSASISLIVVIVFAQLCLGFVARLEKYYKPGTV